MTVRVEEEGAVVLHKVDGNIALLTLNRPASRNAVNARLAAELEELVTQVELDREIGVAVITGAGDRAFCAGADLKEVAAGDLFRTFTRRGGFAGFVDAPRKKPWIAAVNGPALAGGFEIVLACDLVVASNEAMFGLPEVGRGLIASAGGLYRLPRALPKAIALEIILTGMPIDVDRAYSLGLVNRVVPQGDVVAEAMALARQICLNAPLAVSASVEIARAATWFRDNALRRAGDLAQQQLTETADYKEGSRAFVEKRPPRWKGA